MAKTDILAGISRLYVDSNIFIYLVEGRGADHDIVGALLKEAAARNIRLMTSEVTIAECLHGAFKQGNDKLANVYRDLLSAGIVAETIPGDPVLFEYAAYVGASLSLKLIDAIHVASATIFECDAFLTNDRGIRAPENLRIIQLQDTAQAGLLS